MKQMHPLLLISAITICWQLAAPVKAAGVWPDKAYIATYEQTSPYGTSTRKVYWDGHGHGRTEMTNHGKTTIGIVDAPNHKMTLLMPPSKAITVPLTDADIQQMGIAAQAEITGRTPLGVKMIDGHSCRGERYNVGGFTCEAWLDPDIGCFRQTTTTSAQTGVSTSHLSSYSTAQADSALFAIPVSYQTGGNN